MGIEDDRLRLEWISAAEGERVRTVINDMVEKVRTLGPLKLNLPKETAVEEVTAA
jgi:F420-non-reducing hydrogenase iron-sulfur subunit